MAKKLISAEQIESIKEVLADVTYTFFTSHVTINVYQGSFSRWGEDTEDNGSFNNYEATAQIEFGENMSDESKRQETGSDDGQSIQVSFNFRDLKALGLTDGNFVIINPSTDYLTYEGNRYEILAATTDGFLDEEPVLAVLQCRRIEVKT